MDLGSNASIPSDELMSLRARLLRVATGYTRSHADAEDLVQTAMVRWWERRARFRVDTNLVAWMKTVVRNLAIDKTRHDAMVRCDANLQLASPAEDASPFVEWEMVTIEDVVRAAGLCSLPLRTAFAMFYFDRLSLEEIARRNCVSVSTAGTRLHRARQKIREALEPMLIRGEC